MGKKRLETPESKNWKVLLTKRGASSPNASPRHDKIRKVTEFFSISFFFFFNLVKFLLVGSLKNENLEISLVEGGVPPLMLSPKFLKNNTKIGWKKLKILNFVYGLLDLQEMKTAKVSSLKGELPPNTSAPSQN